MIDSTAVSQLKVIESSTTQSTSPWLVFRSWKFAIAKAYFHPSKRNVESICIDSGCTMSLIDRQFLRKVSPEAQIKSVTPITVRGLGTNVHQCSEFVMLDLFLPGKDAAAKIHCGARVVDHLKANMLIGMDIMGPEGIDILISKNCLIIGSCRNIQVPIQVQSREGDRTKRVVQAKEKMTIPPQSASMVPIIIHGKSSLPENRDFLFKSAPINMGPEGGVSASLIDAYTAFVEIKNTTNRPFVIARKHRLGMVEECTAEGDYFTTEEMRPLASGPISWAKKAMTVGLLALGASTKVMNSTSSGTQFDHSVTSSSVAFHLDTAANQPIQ